MDRQNVFAGEVILETDVLSTNRYAYIGTGRTLDAILGSTTQLNGFACTPQTPTPNLSVNVAQGEIYLQQPVDTTQYPVDASNPTSGLPPDPSLIVKQGLTSATVNFPLTTPATPGFSINYLIQVAFLEQDTGSIAREFENILDPNNPIIRVVTNVRQDSAVLTVKAGTPASTGTQVTPTPDVGNTGAWVVAVANGQTQITAPNITEYPGAPFITDKLKDKLSKAIADRLYEKRNFYIDTGTANNYILTLPSLYPPPDAPYIGQPVNFIANATNTGASTVVINGLTAIDITLPSGAPLPAGSIISDQYIELLYLDTPSRYILLSHQSQSSAPIMIAELTADQPLGVGTTTINYTLVTDTFSIWNGTTISPKVVGWYQLELNSYLAIEASGVISLYKNGIFLRVLSRVFETGTAGVNASMVSTAKFYANGTDIFEIIVDIVSGSGDLFRLDPITTGVASYMEVNYLGS